MGKNEGEVWEGEGVQGRGGRMIPGKAEGRVSGEWWDEKVVPGEGERGLGERVPGKGVGGTVVLGEWEEFMGKGSRRGGCGTAVK